MTKLDQQVQQLSRSKRVNPWIQNGTFVDLPLNHPDLLKKAKLDWSVEELGLWRTDMVTVTSKKALVRSDDKSELGIVGVGYTVFQNDALKNTFQDVAGVGTLTVEAAGCLDGGRSVFMLAKVPGMDFVKGDDVTESRLLITNSHDGSASVSVTPMTFRLICSNGLKMLSRIGGETKIANGYKIRHSSGLMIAMEDVADAYARTRANYEATRAAFTALTGKPLSKSAFEAMMTAAFADKRTKDESDRAATIAENRLNAINAILAGPTCNVKGTAGTLWAGLNAITEYIDHARPTRTTDDGASESSLRFQAANFEGTGTRAKDNALLAALSFV